MLEVDAVDVYYGDVQVLKKVSLKVEQGSIVTIIGSNGAGKTTLLKTIAGLLHPKSGSITFNGSRIDGLSPDNICEKGISLVPEGGQLFPAMSVLENLEMGAFKKAARKTLKERLETIYGLFPILKERSNQLAGTLSGGERQMLAIGRALMSTPKLLMLDEPSLGLAPKIMLKVFDTIKHLNRQGLTIILVEQNAYHALSLCRKAYVLETGSVIMEGEGKSLLNNPQVKKAYMGV
jgi:branched-chain amino acid transport system ATP-binding protein